MVRRMMLVLRKYFGEKVRLVEYRKFEEMFLHQVVSGQVDVDSD